MVGLTGCDNDRYNSSMGYQIEDNRLAERGASQSTDQRIEESRTAERVREALAAVADNRYDGVHVIVCDGSI